MATERTVLVRLRANADQFTREMLKAKAAVAALTDRIDTTNDRTAWLAQGLLSLAPAAVTAGATAVPVLVGLATQATVGAAAIGTLALAFSGVGDAVEALNKHQLDPTAESLAAVHAEMRKLGPDGAEFVAVLDQVGEKLSILKMDARAGLLPGMGDGLVSLLDRLPDLRRVVSELASGMGELSAQAGASLASPEWDDFFEFLETDAKPILLDMGQTLGNVVDGFGSLLVAFAPLTREFSSGLLDMARGFESWAENLDQTDGFQEFVAYIRDNAPDVLQMLGSFATAMVELAKAAGPVGEVAVPMLELLADAVGLIADTPLGSFVILGAALTSLIGRMSALRKIAGGPIFTPFTKGISESGKAAKSALPSISSLGTVLYRAGQGAEHASAKTIAARNEVGRFAKAAAPGAASAALLVTAMTPLPEKMGLANAAMGAMAGMMLGPWGAAAGATIGAMLDIAAANNAVTDSIRNGLAAAGTGDLDSATASLTKAEADLDAFADKVEWDSNDIVQSITGLGLVLNGAKIKEGFEDLVGESDLEEAEEGISELREQVQELDEATRRAASFDEYNKRLETDSESASKSAETFRNLAAAYEEPELKLRELMDRMREWGRAAADMGANVQTALANGVSPEALDYIIEKLGPSAGLALEELAKGGKKAADDANAAWKRLNRELGIADSAFNDVKDRLRDLPTPTIDLNDGNFRKKVRRALDDVNVLDAAEINPYASMNVQPLLEAANRADRRMGEVDKNGPSPEVSLYGVPQAIGELNRLTSPKSVTVTAQLNAGAAWAKLQAMFGRGAASGSANAAEQKSGGNPADGGTIPLFGGRPRRSAEGSTVPDDGGPYADRFPYLLAPLEEVISNRTGQADEFRPELKDINAGMTRAQVFERMLARGLANGGTTGATLGAPVWSLGGLPSVASMPQNVMQGLDLGPLPRAVKELKQELKESKKALERETAVRDALASKMESLSSDVSGGLLSELFGETSVWSDGDSFESVMAKLAGDTVRGEALSRNIATLGAKGLDGDALSALLSGASDTTIAAWANGLTEAQLAAFEAAFDRRGAVAMATGGLAASTSFGDDKATADARSRRLEVRLERIEKAIDRSKDSNRDEQAANRQEQRKGAGKAARNRNRGYVTLG